MHEPPSQALPKHQTMRGLDAKGSPENPLQYADNAQADCNPSPQMGD